MLSALSNLLRGSRTRCGEMSGSITLTLLLFGVVMTMLFMTVLVFTDTSVRRTSHILEERARARFMAESGMGAAILVLADNISRVKGTLTTGKSKLLEGLDCQDFDLPKGSGFKCLGLEILSARRGGGQSGSMGIIARIRIQGFHGERKFNLDRTVTF